MDYSAAAKIMMADNNGGTAPSGLTTLSITQNKVDKKASEEHVVGWNAINLAIPVAQMKVTHNHVTIKAVDSNLEAFVSAESDLSLTRAYITDPFTDYTADPNAETDPEAPGYDKHIIKTEGFGSAYVNLDGEAKYITQNGTYHAQDQSANTMGFTRYTVNVPSNSQAYDDAYNALITALNTLQQLQEKCGERQMIAERTSSEFVEYFPTSTTASYDALCNLAEEKLRCQTEGNYSACNKSVSRIFDLTKRQFVAPAYHDEGSDRGRYLKIYLYNMAGVTGGNAPIELGGIYVPIQQYNSTGSYVPTDVYDGSGKDCQIRLQDFRVTNSTTGDWEATATAFRVSTGGQLWTYTVSGQNNSLIGFGQQGHQLGIGDSFTYNYKPAGFS